MRTLQEVARLADLGDTVTIVDVVDILKRFYNLHVNDTVNDGELNALQGESTMPPMEAQGSNTQAQNTFPQTRAPPDRLGRIFPANDTIGRPYGWCIPCGRNHAGECFPKCKECNRKHKPGRCREGYKSARDRNAQQVVNHLQTQQQLTIPHAGPQQNGTMSQMGFHAHQQPTQYNATPYGGQVYMQPPPHPQANQWALPAVMQHAPQPSQGMVPIELLQQLMGAGGTEVKDEKTMAGLKRALGMHKQ